MVNSSDLSSLVTLMSNLLMSSIIPTQEDLEPFRKYFDKRQLDELSLIRSDYHELIELFTEINSLDNFSTLLTSSRYVIRTTYLRIQSLLLEIVHPERNDYTNLINLLDELAGVDIDFSGLEYVDFHVSQLDETQAQRLHISMEDFDYFQNSWLRMEIQRSIRENDINNPKWQNMDTIASLAALFFSVIASIVGQPIFRPSFPIMIDSFYDVVANLNFIIDEQDSQPDLITQPPQNLDALGYGKGRFEGETDQEVDEFIHIIQEIRLQS